MKDRYRIPILLVLFIIMVYQLQRRGKEEYQKDSLLLKNNFKMEGIVDSFYVSNNHCFAVIYLNVFQSNVKYFNPKKENNYFPYAINDGKAEIYTQVCASQIDVGDSVLIDSNYRTVYFKTKSIGNHQGEINFVQGDIGYIKEKSKLFPENFIKK